MTEQYHEYLVSQSKSGGKFWEVEVVGEEMRTRYGKLGQDRAWSAKAYPTHEKALQEAKKKAASKKRSGYSPAPKPVVVDSSFSGDLASLPFQGVFYFRALDRYPGGNADMIVIKLVLDHIPDKTPQLRAKMHWNFDGDHNIYDDAPVTLDLTETLPAWLDAAKTLVDAGLVDTHNTILDPRYDHEEYDTEWSSIDAVISIWPEGEETMREGGGNTVLSVEQRALSYTSTCDPPAPETAAFIAALQAMVGIDRVEPMSDGGNRFTAHFNGPHRSTGYTSAPMPLYL